VVNETIMSGPYRAGFRLDKYNNDRTPDDGEPDEVIIISKWFEFDGTPIEDEARIADLEERYPMEG
jgi:hypothetical protein